MQSIDGQTLAAWLETGQVLEKDGRGPKVVALEDGHFLKIFHTRRAPWLARLQPPAQGFARNAADLKARCIAAPEIIECFWIDKAQGLSACRYCPVPGCSLETLMRTKPATLPALLPHLARFIRTLHRSGVYFRSLHLGNIMVEEGKNDAPFTFGLIDILDLKCTPRPLGAWKIRRNFKHLQHALERRKLAFPLAELRRLYDEI